MKIEITNRKQFPFKIHGIGNTRPQFFTMKALIELQKLIELALKECVK